MMRNRDEARLWLTHRYQINPLWHTVDLETYIRRNLVAAMRGPFEWSSRCAYCDRHH